MHNIEDKQVNLNKLIFNGSAKLFEFPKRTSVPPAHSYPSGKRYTTLQKRFQPKEICMQKQKKGEKKKKNNEQGERNQKKKK